MVSVVDVAVVACCLILLVVRAAEVHRRCLGSTYPASAAALRLCSHLRTNSLLNFVVFVAAGDIVLDVDDGRCCCCCCCSISAAIQLSGYCHIRLRHCYYYYNVDRYFYYCYYCYFLAGLRFGLVSARWFLLACPTVRSRCLGHCWDDRVSNSVADLCYH